MRASIKVVRFLAGEPPLAEDLRRCWTAVLEADGGARPAPGRPVRVALAVPLDMPELPPPRFAAVDLQWFVDVGEGLANEAWLGAADPDLCLGSPLLGRGSCRVVAEEVVLRGRDNLDARWEAGGERSKMMSFGRRHPTLSLDEFSTRWRAEAGRLGGEQIPEDVRGSAYVQNHPVRVDGHDWPFDAVNEVYVERLDELRRRSAWMAARQDRARRADTAPFMSPTETWSMCLREELMS